MWSPGQDFFTKGHNLNKLGNATTMWILFYAFPIKAYVKHVAPGWVHFGNIGIILANLVEVSTRWY